MGIANFITVLRMVGTGMLLYTAPLTPAFYLFYTLCGITDALDGIIARETKTASALGARLDSIADLMFCGVMLWKLTPLLWAKLPVGVWCLTGGILLVRITSYIVAAVKHGTFASLHTVLNKLTGLLVFLLPYFVAGPFLSAFGWASAIVAGIASLEELILHIQAREYCLNVPSWGSMLVQKASINMEKCVKQQNHRGF